MIIDTLQFAEYTTDAKTVATAAPAIINTEITADEIKSTLKSSELSWIFGKSQTHRDIKGNVEEYVFIGKLPSTMQRNLGHYALSAISENGYDDGRNMIFRKGMIVVTITAGLQTVVSFYRATLK